MSDNLLENDKNNDPVKQKQQTLPSKFIDSETGEIRIEALVKSYLELERKLSQTAKPPETEEEKARMARMLGCPDCAEDYDIEIPHEFFTVDPQLNQKFFEMGFTQAQVQTVYDAAAEKMIPLIADMAAEFQADREVEKLVDKFGSQEKWQEISRQMLSYGRKNLPDDVLAGLASSYEGIMALYRMMKNEVPSLKLKSDQHINGAEDEKSLYAMMKDPKYWKEKDPSFIAKVTKGFEDIYKS
ncbi:MAG: hypothetical protein CL565_05355 [Alphaproteobacteria bacterium]|nr:hypothetical protein [Alphaproteobacteria bacterium]